MILAGTNSLNGSGVTQDVVEIIVHEKYSYASLKDDIALLRVKNNFTFDSSIKAVKLMEQEIMNGAEIIISGWGLTDRTSPFSNEMKFNTMFVVNQRVCEGRFGRDYKGLLCLGHSMNSGVCYVSLTKSAVTFQKIS